MTYLSRLPARRVRKVRLWAPEESLLRRGAILLEDALQTASLRDEQSDRLLLIRSLDIGPIRSGSSSAHLSLAIEQRLLQLGVEIVEAQSPAAAAARAVYFRDRVAALVGLASRLQRGPEPAEWFWPLAVPGFQAGQAVSAALRNLLDTALRSPPGVGSMAVFLGALQAEAALDPLLAALRPQDGPALLQACGWSWPAMPKAPSPLPAAWARILERWTSEWGPSDVRSLWLAGAALAAGRPARLAAPQELTGAALGVLRALDDTRQGQAPTPAAAGLPETRITRKPDSENGQQTAALPRQPPAHGAIARASGLPAAAATPVAQRRGDPAPATYPHSAGERTTLAGLFFLLPLLARLGLPGFLKLRPDLVELDLPQRILLRAAARFSLPPDDPALAALAPRASLPVPPAGPVPFVAPANWPAALCRPASLSHPWQVRRLGGDASARVLLDGAGQLVLALWRHRPNPSIKQLIQPATPKSSPHPSIQAPRPAASARGLCYHRTPLSASTGLDLLLDSWVTALRRRLRYDTGLALGQLVRRLGHLSFSPTNVEVSFDLQKVDLRLRRAGLDLDPGWLAWFGKVVKFIYD